VAGQFNQSGMPFDFSLEINCREGNLNGRGQDGIGPFEIHGDTDGQGITWRKDYLNGNPSVFYEGRLVGNRARIEGMYGFAPGQMVDQFWCQITN